MAGVSTKDIKLRIRSMENTKQITKAMEMVAASKLRRAQDRIQKSRPYFETLYSAISEMAMNTRDLTSRYLQVEEKKKVCCIVIAGDRGLAGGYNSNVLKLAEEAIAGREAAILPIGKKALEHFRSRGYEIVTDIFAEAALLSISKCFSMARGICQQYMAGEFDEICLTYTNYVSILTQTPSMLPVLPLIALPKSETAKVAANHPTMYEPNGEMVFNSIVPEYVGGLIYGALCESLASELSARRTAMDAATKNAEEMIDDLGLKYNRARQSAITQEITEIVAGADA